MLQKKFVFCGTKAIVCVVLALAPSVVSAEVYLDVSGFSGYTVTTVPTGSVKPTLFAGGGGATLGWSLGWLAVGASSDFRSINQTSEIAAEVGNRRGTRWNIVSPTLILRAGNFSLKGDVQLLGDYKLSNQALDGAKLSYRSPSGFRGGLIYAFSPVVGFGAFYEKVSFGKLSASTTGETTLANKLSVWQAGMSAIFTLSGAQEVRRF
jgi:hypothetical protein